MYKKSGLTRDIFLGKSSQLYAREELKSRTSTFKGRPERSVQCIKSTDIFLAISYHTPPLTTNHFLCRDVNNDRYSQGTSHFRTRFESHMAIGRPCESSRSRRFQPILDNVLRVNKAPAHHFAVLASLVGIQLRSCAHSHLNLKRQRPKCIQIYRLEDAGTVIIESALCRPPYTECARLQHTMLCLKTSLSSNVPASAPVASQQISFD